MIKTEFGIIDKIDTDKDYGHHEPEKYNCVYIDDDIYIDEWWEQLQTIKTFYHSLNRPGYALARYGVTIIPPDSLNQFLHIVISDPKFQHDPLLLSLSEVIQKAIRGNKHMIHFGI
ncbi:TPA: hypothetical protein OBP09_002196 [Escherichia coli]|uniref:hypothetical protein n=1 Tax=Escherichia coli TaxID=562 RepID=UPI000BE1F000|nr:hypothetical protein [Escherichia coli]EFN8443238.1 hypothetical protein [Escherichia coli O5]AXZ71923.1 hypothetical protein D3W53_03710 [Escherichia coli]EEV5865849.1 hypothetical protein [Escherichia coli]EFF3040046.1 hypothetical protein [Escherichia coli]EFH9069680.1 hypothetical protein [Escherichia coli]